MSLPEPDQTRESADMDWAARIDAARARLSELEVEALGVTAGADLTYLCGYEAMPLERITMFVVGTWSEPVLVVPELEAPRVADRGGMFEVVTWADGEDALDVCARVLRRVGHPGGTFAIGDRAWASHLLGLQRHLAHARWIPASNVLRDLRVVKSSAEVTLLREAGAAIDRVVDSLASMAWQGRTEADVAAEIGDAVVASGHERVNFVIVAAGENAASPHHEPGETIIEAGDCVLVDIGGTRRGYCSDTTRVVSIGAPADEISRAWESLRAAQEAATQAVAPGVTAESIDAAARDRLDADGYGAAFIHRTGHGIGLDAHEDPYIVAGNAEELRPGMCFSIEPGIYVAGRFGLRLEDIVVVTTDGVEVLNRTGHDLVVLG